MAQNESMQSEDRDLYMIIELVQQKVQIKYYLKMDSSPWKGKQPMGPPIVFEITCL